MWYHVIVERKRRENKMCKKFILPILILSAGLSVSAAGANFAGNTAGINLENPLIAVSTPAATRNYIQVKPLDMVNNPSFYLNKYVKIKGKFDKFTTLGLDYKPAMKSSEDFITFLIQRPDVTDHNVPLSELKIFLKRSEAEKHIDLNAGDEIEFSGKVFSNALGDVWMDVEQFKVLTVKTKTTDKK